ncbi:MAG: HGGxSTG domain-containing protein [Gammaproteobacteria bacterium]
MPGSPCQAPAAWDKLKKLPVNGRCKLHGGLSTGPKTAEGKRRTALAARDGMKRFSAERHRHSNPPA